MPDQGKRTLHAVLITFIALIGAVVRLRWMGHY